MGDFPFDDTADQQLEANIDRALDELGHLDRAMRAQAMRELVAIGTPAVPPLIEYVQDGFSPARARAAEVLGRIGDARAVNILVQLLTDNDEVLRCNAAEALGYIGGPEAIGALVQARHDSRPRVQAAARDALQRLNALPADDAQHDVDPVLINRLTHMLSSRPAYAREQAGSALVRIGAPAVPYVIGVLAAEQPFARRAAVDVLRFIGSDKAVAPLRLVATQDPDALVRQLATMALHAIETASAQG